MAFFRSPLLRRVIYLIAFGMALLQLSHHARSMAYDGKGGIPVAESRR